MIAEPPSASSRPTYYPSAWSGVMSGPIAWAINQETNFAMTSRACAVGDRNALHLVTLACLGIMMLGAGIAAFNLAWERRSPIAEGSASQVRFLAILGLMANPFFALVMIAQRIAIAMLDPCPR